MSTYSDDLLLDDSPHTQAKHLLYRLYRYYLDAWLPILLLGKVPRVRIVDGFAGPGRYRVTDREGSPQVAIRAILGHSQLKAALHSKQRILLQFIELRLGRVTHLKQELAALPTRPIFRSSKWSALPRYGHTSIPMRLRIVPSAYEALSRDHRMVDQRGPASAFTRAT